MTDKENGKKEIEHDDADADEESSKESAESVYEIFSEKFANFRKFVKEDCRWLVLNSYVQNEEYITVDSRALDAALVALKELNERVDAMSEFLSTQTVTLVQNGEQTTEEDPIQD